MDDREQAIAATKQRMAAFRLRHSPSATNLTFTAPQPKLHARSHSRNNSVTNFPISTLNASAPADNVQETSGPVPSSPSLPSRPNSHHRRRSSVSTRRESAEMMGVTPPPESASELPGDQSDFRHLALWKLEGKSCSDNAFIGGFTKVEIPELNTPETDLIEAVQSAKSKPTLSAFGMGNSLAGKRDSFGKLLMSASNSVKDQLHTLMEEEEEDEEEDSGKGTSPTEELGSFRANSPVRDEIPVARPSVIHPNRHRPTNLTLRPLSLTPESLPLTRSDSLPTPSPTPSPRIGGLKSLTLTPSPSPSPVPSNASVSSVSSESSRRQSLSISPSPQPQAQMQRRLSLGTAPNARSDAPKRKSSISYRRAPSGEYQLGYLPTPGPTPTSPVPPLHSVLPSSASSILTTDLDRRPLSPTEQAFLFRSHTSLLSRISDLEKAIADGRGRLPPGSGVGLDANLGLGLEELRDRSRSSERPMSIMSATSESDSLMSVSSQPSDEMLQLVSDLKAERDELMRDADAWRTRIGNLEKQIGTLTRRVEAERREAWVIRERLGLLEVEKKRIWEDFDRGRLECKRLEEAVRAATEAKVQAEEERVALSKALMEEKQKCAAGEPEVESLRKEVEQLRARADQADADLQALLVTPKVEMQTQVPVPRRFDSVDSATSTGSLTDVEECVYVSLRTLKLNAVEEEDEERDLPKDVSGDSGSESGNDELAHYEDNELDDDMIFGDDMTSSSFGSIARPNSHLLRLDLAAAAPVPAQETTPIVPPSHGKTGSMEKGWAFPHGGARPLLVKKDAPKVDHFFECLNALDENDAEEAIGLSTYDSATAKQFWRGAVQDNDDEMPPFLLPTQSSPSKKGKDWKEIEAVKLAVVAEEEDEDEEMIPFNFPTFSRALRGEFDSPVTPRPAASSRMLPVAAGTPTKHPKTRKMSIDLTIPGFKPYSGSVPILKAPPPPRGVNSPVRVSPSTPTKNTLESVTKQASISLIPQRNQSPPSASSTKPPKPRVSGATYIPRLCTSPTNCLPSTASVPTKTTTAPVPAMKLTPPPMTMTTSEPPALIPQPKMTSKPVKRSSPLPHQPPMLTRLSIFQQTAAPATSRPTQGLTAKLSQQMQSLTSLWSPWNSSPSTAGKPAVLSGSNMKPEQRWVRGYVSKERQLERLRLRLQREGAVTALCEQCTCCRDAVIII